MFIKKCDECSYLVWKRDAQKVRVENYEPFYRNYNLYYCPQHKKPYILIKSFMMGTQYFKKLNGELIVLTHKEFKIATKNNQLT